MKLYIGLEEPPEGFEQSHLDLLAKLDDSSVAEMILADVIQRRPRAEWSLLVDEVWRVMVPDGQVTVTHPHIRASKAWADPTFLDVIPLERWGWVSRNWRSEHSFEGCPGYPTCDFDIVGFNYLNVSNEFVARADTVKLFATSHYWDVASDVMVALKALKG